MHNTAYPQVDALLTDLLSAHQRTLGDRLTGLYLFGSLTTGVPAGSDFDPRISDVDLLAALTVDPDVTTAGSLAALHDALAARYPAFAGRIEVIYLSVEGLRTCKTAPREGAVISPGEPFHLREINHHWLVNWYMVREAGVTLYGPPPDTLIPPISREEFVACIREHLDWWRETVLEGGPEAGQIENRRGAQAYVVLTMCRALYALAHGTQGSKPVAAAWAAERYPAWSGLIAAALSWRAAGDQGPLHPAELAEIARFVAFALSEAE